MHPVKRSVCDCDSGCGIVLPMALVFFTQPVFELFHLHLPRSVHSTVGIPTTQWWVQVPPALQLLRTATVTVLPCVLFQTWGQDPGQDARLATKMAPPLATVRSVLCVSGPCLAVLGVRCPRDHVVLGLPVRSPCSNPSGHLPTPLPAV